MSARARHKAVRPTAATKERRARPAKAKARSTQERGRAPMRAAAAPRPSKTTAPRSGKSTPPPLDLAAEKRRARTLNRRLATAHPDARCSLDHSSPLELLVATILSAQCTDERVNLVTPILFRRYPTAEDLASARQEDIEELVRSTGFFRNKARAIKGAATLIAERHDGTVPDSMEELLTLPGVARKTANVVLGTAFGKAAGVVVDTHVTRVAGRLGLTRERDPEKIERDLMALLPQGEWVAFSHRVIHHGRRICTARKPRCTECPLADLCPSAEI